MPKTRSAGRPTRQRKVAAPARKKTAKAKATKATKKTKTKTTKAGNSYTGRRRTPSRRVIETLKSNTEEEQPDDAEKPKKKRRYKRKQIASVSTYAGSSRNTSPSQSIVSSRAASATAAVHVNVDEIQCFLCSNDDYSDETQYPIGSPLHDPCNEILLCDSPTCKAVAFHQRCHFVPVFVIPRGTWVCLLCRYEAESGISPSEKPGSSSAAAKKGGKGTAQHSQLLHEFDHNAKHLKAEYTFEILQHLSKSIDQSIARIRTSENTIRTYTETERSRKSLIAHFPRVPSELVHAKLRYAQSKVRIRHQLLSMKRYIEEAPPRPEPRFDSNDRVQDASDDGDDDEEEEVAEEREGEEEDYNSQSTGADKRRPEQSVSLEEGVQTTLQQEFDEKSSGVNEEEEVGGGSDGGSSDDGSSQGGSISSTSDASGEMIDSSKIVCCVCHDGHSTDARAISTFAPRNSFNQDENDVIMCDGKNCFRAFHMRCLRPQLSVEMLEKLRPGSDIWFCPFCTKLATFIHHVQEEYHGDDGYSTDWGEPEDVFSEAEDEYRSAHLLKEGKAPLSALLGTDPYDSGSSQEGESDDEEEEEDEDFDPDKPEIRDGLHASDDEKSLSSLSSNASKSHEEGLRDELAALSSAEDESLSGDRKSRRRNTRSRSQTGHGQSDDSPVNADVGDLDASNIVKGKRRRTKVDYRKLHDSMFGDVPADEAKAMFGEEDDAYHDGGDDEMGNLDEHNIVSGKRRRTKVDYRKLAKEMFDKGEDDGSDDNAEWSPSRTSRGGNRTRRGSTDTSDDDDEAPGVGVKHRRGRYQKKGRRESAAKGAGQKDQSTVCSCKRSRCLQKYCICFANSRLCSEECNCVDCRNPRDSGGGDRMQEKPHVVQSPRMTDEAGAVDGKKSASTRDIIAQPPEKKKRIPWNKPGNEGPDVCMCKNSRCLKKYCVCFANSKSCSEDCTCRTCSNPFNNGAPSVAAPSEVQMTLIKSAPASPHEKRAPFECEDEVESKLPKASEAEEKFANADGKNVPKHKPIRHVLLSLSSPKDDKGDATKQARPYNISADKEAKLALLSSDPKNKKSAKSRIKADGATVCNCKKSKCLKLYCCCYANSRRCTDVCQCKDCSNTEDMAFPAAKPVLLHPMPALEPKHMKEGPLEKEPSKHQLPFNEKKLPMADQRSTITSSMMTNEEVPPWEKKRRSSKAGNEDGPSVCSCKKARCAKLYCACYAKARPCSSECTCVNCRNPCVLGSSSASQASARREHKNIKDSFEKEAYKARSPSGDQKIAAVGSAALPYQRSKYTGGSASEPASKPLPKVKKQGGALVKDEGPETCSCKRSRCVKLYCVCYAESRPCSVKCTCLGCRNPCKGDPIAVAAKKVPQLPIIMPKPAKPILYKPPHSYPEGPPKPIVNDKIAYGLQAQDGGRAGGGSSLGERGLAVAGGPAGIGEPSLQSPGSDRGFPPSNADSDDGPTACSCKKSKCLKMYCVCYANSKRCTSRCKCHVCMNKVCPDHCRCHRCSRTNQSSTSFLPSKMAKTSLPSAHVDPARLSAEQQVTGRDGGSKDDHLFFRGGAERDKSASAFMEVSMKDNQMSRSQESMGMSASRGEIKDDQTYRPQDDTYVESAPGVRPMGVHYYPHPGMNPSFGPVPFPPRPPMPYASAMPPARGPQSGNVNQQAENAYKQWSRHRFM